MTSPEQGAQHECSNTLLAPLGGVNWGRCTAVVTGCGFIDVISYYLLFFSIDFNKAASTTT
ncbi:hypothetical protein SALWKB12_0748 [Snodgrassella communis]|uniref:Uncharacterized protein n=1 Tax=Snodgrassella communis TaxID=2946699 RepID=A0A836Z5S0_9NEIS|nr:hypothetical protein SALWKB12_0748 [Snodgrassella communis]KDN15249.1 hypothetical protein SALWKB29_0875 [Snodgrassella communis]